MKIKNVNIIKSNAKKIKQARTQIDRKVVVSIIISTGCRISEAMRYKVVYRGEKNTNQKITLSIPVLKKRKKEFRHVTVSPELFGLTTGDFSTNQSRIGLRRRYYDFMIKCLGFNQREYRSMFAAWLLINGRHIADIRDFLAHSSISVTDHYMKKRNMDFGELLQY